MLLYHVLGLHVLTSATLTSFDLANETGVLATVGAALAVDGEADVLGFTLCSRESRKTVHLITEDPDPTLATLDGVATGRRSREVLLVELRGGTPGLGDVGRRLAEAGVNVESTLSIENGPAPRVAIAVDEPECARKALDKGGRLRPMP